MPVLNPQGHQRHLGPASTRTGLLLHPRLPRDLLNLLSTHNGGLERADVVVVFATMHLWWAEDSLVPEFINRFNNAQKKATHNSLPITNDWLAAMATSTLLWENSFPN